MGLPVTADINTIIGSLLGGTNVNINTTSADTQNGDITVVDPINVNFLATASPILNLNAAGSILVNAPITATGLGSLNLTFDAATATTIAADLSTNGGLIDAQSVGSGIVNFTGTRVIDAPFAASVINIVGGNNISLNDVTDTNTLTISGGILQGTGNIDINTLFTWTGGNMNGTRTTTVPAGVSLNIIGANTKTLRRTFINQSALATWDGTGAFTIRDGGVFDNQATGVFTVLNDDLINGAAGDATFINAGAFVKNGGAGTTTIQGTGGNGLVFDNSGTIDVLTGTLLFSNNGLAAQDSTHSGTITIAGGSEVVLNAGTQQFNLGADVIGPGLLRVNGSATVDINTALSTDALQLDDGTIDGVGALTIDTSLVFNGGNMNGTGTTTGPVGVSLDFTGVNNKTLRRTLINQSALATWDGAGSFVIRDGGVFDNQATGVFTVLNDDLINGAAGDATFINSGAFIKNGGAGTTTIQDSGGNGLVFDNSGTIDVLTGTLLFSNNGLAAQDSTHSGTITIAGGSEVILNLGTQQFNAGADVGGAGVLRISGAIMEVTAPMNIDNLQIDSGELNGTGDVLIDQSLVMIGGAMNGTGTTTVPVSASVTFNTASTKALSRTLINQSASSIWNDTGTLNIANGGIFDNQGTLTVPAGTTSNLTGAIVNQSGTIEIQSDLALGNSTLNIAAGFVNDGIIELDSDGNVSTLNVLAGPLVNNNIIRTNGTAGPGSRDITGAITNLGTIDVTQALTINNLGTTFDTSAGTLMLAAGETLAVIDGTTVVGTGTAFLDTGTLSLEGTHALNLASDFMLTAGLALPGTVLTNASTLTLIDETLDANINFDNQGTLIIPPNTTSNIDGVVVNQSGTIQIQSDPTGPGTLNFANAFSNDGLIELESNGNVATLNLATGFITNNNTIQTAGTAGAGSRFLDASLINNGTVNATQSLDVPSIVSIDHNGGAFNIGAGELLTLTGGVFTWNDGDLNGPGDIIFGPTVLIVDGPFFKSLGTGITLAPPNLTVGGTGPLAVNGGNLNVAGLTIIDPGATLRISTPTFTTNSLNNDGLLDLDAGTLVIPGGGVNTNTFDAAAGTVIDFAGGATQFNGITNLLGAGTYQFTGGTLDINTLTNIGPSATLLLTAAGFDGAGTLDNAGNFVVEGTSSFSGGNLNNTGTTLIQATDANGAAFLQLGTLTNSGNIQLFNNASLPSPATLDASGTIDNAGVIELGNGTGGITALSGVLTNNLTGVIDVRDTSGIDGLGSTVTNNGTVQLTTGDLSVANNTGFANQGFLDIPARRVFSSAGTFSNANILNLGGTLNTPFFSQTAAIGVTQLQGGTLIAGTGVNINAGLLAGNGGIIGDVVNNGLVAPGLSPGFLAISGNYVQTSAGALDIELGGLIPGSEHDVLQISGTATLGGTLDVLLFGGFFPTDGDQFDVLSYSSASGDFAAVITPPGVTLSTGDQGSVYQLAVTSAMPPPPPPGPEPEPPMGNEGSEAETLTISEIIALEEMFEETTEEVGDEDDDESTILMCS